MNMLMKVTPALSVGSIRTDLVHLRSCFELAQPKRDGRLNLAFPQTLTFFRLCKYNGGHTAKLGVAANFVSWICVRG